MATNKLRFGRRRSFPLNIQPLGGAGLGSSTFLGKMVSELSTTFNNFRDEEAFQNLADGHPEEFIAYATSRLSSVSGATRDQLLSYIGKAKDKMQLDKEDAAAIEKYTRTNNHAEYLDYLTKRLDKTTDPAARTKVESQIAQLRTALHPAGTASQTGTTPQEDFIAKRKAYDAAVIVAKGKTNRGETLTDKDIESLNNAAADYSDVLTAIENDASVSWQNRLNARNARIEAAGPDLYPGTAIENNDKKVLDDAGVTIGGSISAGRNAFNDSLKSMTPRQKAAAQAKHASEMDLALTGVRGADEKRAVTAELNRTETDARQTLLGMTTGPHPAAPDADTLGRQFEKYRADLQNKKDAGITKEVPVGYDEFVRAAKYAQDAAAFSGSVNIDVSDKFFKTVHEAAAPQQGAAVWDPAENAFVGNKDAVADAEAAVTIAQNLSRTNPGLFADLTSGESGGAGPITTEDWFRLGKGEPLDPWRAGGLLDESTRAARQRAVAPEDKPTATGDTAPVSGKGGMQSPLGQPDQSLAEPTPETSTEPPPDQGQPDQQDAQSGADLFLKTDDIPDIPADIAPPPVDTTDLFGAGDVQIDPGTVDKNVTQVTDLLPQRGKNF